MGHCWVVGVGPGDPELLTVKAVALLSRAHVIYHPGPTPDQGRAWAVVRDLIRPEQQVRLVLAGSMHQAAARADRAAYRPAADRIASDCRAGLDVAVLTEGDPTLYSTASYVWELLADLYPDVPVEVVPGVNSITAAAARVGWPLAQHGEAVAIVPASYHSDELHSLLERFPTICFLKVAQTLPDLRAALDSRPGEWEAAYAENVTTAAERITHDLATVEGGPYFALVLVRRAAAPASGGRKPPEGRAGDLPQGAYAPRSPAPLSVIGLGPGDARLLTPQALEALHAAEVIVGYDVYLDALRPLGLRGELRGSPIGSESERARLALDLAAAGRRVALVSSGDAGVYGMASLVLETAGAAPGVEVEIVPGVTAALAAAALLGAPLGHDFACISLSELLTPWPLIERRLDAAAQGDLAIALYNPVSRRRTWQLPRARDILLTHRRPETPVGLVDRAYRPGMRVWTTTLAELSGEGVGMETVVIVGSSATRMVSGRMVTPRGYPLAACGLAGASAKPQAARAQAEPGQRILAESFARIERELGPRDLAPWVLAVVRRMIHASADFDFARTLRYSPDFEAAVRAALLDGAPVVTDTEMVRLGILTALGERPGQVLACYLNDPETLTLAESAGLTRSAAGMRVAARRHAAPLLAIGNAPTALDEALRLVEEEGWRPAALVGIPVGFVGVEEAKQRLLAQERVPYLTCVERKGGSAVTAAAVNALVEVFGLS